MSCLTACTYCIININVIFAGGFTVNMWGLPISAESFRPPSHGCTTEVPEDEYLLEVSCAITHNLDHCVNKSSASVSVFYVCIQ